MNPHEALTKRGVHLGEVRHHKLEAATTVTLALLVMGLALEKSPGVSSSAGAVEPITPTPETLPTPLAPTVTAEIHLPDSAFIAAAEQSLSRPYQPGVPAPREHYQNMMGYQIGRLAEKRQEVLAGPAGFLQRETPINFPIVDQRFFPMIDQRLGRVQSGEAVVAIAQVSTKNPDGSTDVFLLLAPASNTAASFQTFAPQYVRLQTIFPNGSKESYGKPR